jgi:hypothetical protein
LPASTSTASGWRPPISGIALMAFAPCLSYPPLEGRVG